MAGHSLTNLQARTKKKMMSRQAIILVKDKLILTVHARELLQEGQALQLRL